MISYSIGEIAMATTALFHVSGTSYGFKSFKPMQVKKIAHYIDDDVVFRPRQYRMKDLKVMHPSLLLNQIYTDNLADVVHIVEFADMLVSHYAFLIPLPNDRNIDLILVNESDVHRSDSQSQFRKDKDLVRKVQNQKSWNVAGIKGKL